MTRSKVKYDNESHARMLRNQHSKIRADAASEKLYEAHWLLSGSLGSAVWETKIPNSTETIIIDFNHRLPDGSLLTDPANEKMLITIQKYAFDLRLGRYTKSVISPDRWAYSVNYVKQLCSWMTLNEAIYQPKKYGFMQLDLNGCESYLKQLSEGGYSAALLYKERFISHMHKTLNHRTHLQDLLDNPNQLDKGFIEDTINWLKTHDLYTPGSVGSNWFDSTVSREYLAQVLGASSSSTSNSVNFRHFVRQFEPGLANQELLISATRRTLYPSQNVIRLDDAENHTIGESAYKDQIHLLASFLKGHSTLPNDIPDIKIDIKAVMSEAVNRLKRAGHTNLIPLTIGMRSLNEACKWVLTYGEAIVAALIHHIPSFVEIDKNWCLARQSIQKQKEFEESFDQWMVVSWDGSPPQKLIEALNIARLQQKKTKDVKPGITTFRAVMDAFIGACALLIGMLKPIRNKEICYLTRDCMSGVATLGGVLLNHESGKSGVMGINDLVNRPIPSITAHAIQLLQLLGNNLCKAYGDDSIHSQDLFYFPGRGFKRPARKSLRDRVNKCLDQFCDMIELPVDDVGRRWYIRTHEMRKFFLLIMHRHEGQEISDFLSYSASHVERRIIGEYTAYHADYDEYLRYESECVEDKLIAYEAGQYANESRNGLAALYHHTLKHFGVTSLYSVRQAEYFELVSDMRQRNQFEITTFSIVLESYKDEVIAIDFAIRFGDKTDAQFNP